MKAQASLEMVVGLIILLVVAGVVIGLVLHFISPESFPDVGEQVNKKHFLSKCEGFCDDVNSIDYCTYFWGEEQKDMSIHKDWDGDGISNEPIEVGGTVKWETCEDRIYCFLIQPCSRFGDGGVGTLNKCKRIICQSLTSKYGNDDEGIELANKKLKEIIDVFPCDLDSLADYDNWYIQGRFGDGCG